MEARAHALLHDARAAREALVKAERTYGLLAEHQVKPNVLGIHEQLMLYCRGNTLTLLMEYGAALDTYTQAIGISSSHMDTALCVIDQAICLASLDELSEAVRRVRQAMTRLPPESRQGLPQNRLHQIAAANSSKSSIAMLSAEISKSSAKVRRELKSESLA